MIACSRAFLFKHYPLQAWLDFSQKFGLPGLRGTTSATRGTPEFAEMEDALRTFMSELAVVTNTAESIDIIELKGTGQPPFSELVERMDRVMASLWRGADLSTLSRDRGYGATLQEQEARVLEQDDARTISEHLNATIDRWVLEQVFGPSVQSLARIKILVSPRECTPHDLQIDHFLVEHGAKLSLSETLERYGRAQAGKGELWLTKRGTEDPMVQASKDAFEHRGGGFMAAEGGLSYPNRPSIASPPRNIVSRHLNNENAPQIAKLMKTNLSNSSCPPMGTAKVSNARRDDRISELKELSNGPNNSSLCLKQPIDDYIQISPLGIFPHVRGLQNVDRAALENLVTNFNSFLGRLGRRFAGIPFYVGHPDVPGFENIYSDRKAYGWIMDLTVRDDGLYARTNWSAAGRDLISNGHFKFLSPYWEAKRVGEREGRGIFSPTVLKSVGLTNEPNLPVLPLANSGDELLEDSFLGIPISLIPEPAGSNSSPADSLSNTTEDRTTKPGTEPPQPQVTTVSTAGLSGAEMNSPQPLELEALKETIANCQRDIIDLRRQLLTSVLDNALAESRILPAERAHWFEALTADFENTSATLASTSPKLNSIPVSANLVRVASSEATEHKQKRILALVNEKMRFAGISYHEAWLDLRAHKPELF